MWDAPKKLVRSRKKYSPPEADKRPIGCWERLTVQKSEELLQQITLSMMKPA